MATIKSFTPKSAINAKAHRKENRLFRSFVLFDLETKRELIEIRTYWPGTVCYACVWVRPSAGEYANGSAKAGGYGYDKEESAVKHAILNAGFEMEEGYNHHSSENILHGIAAFWGLTNYHIFRAHG